MLVIIYIAISYLVVDVLTFLFNEPPHLFFHVHELLDHIILLGKLLNVNADFIYLFSDPSVNTHHIFSLTLPL